MRKSLIGIASVIVLAWMAASIVLLTQIRLECERTREQAAAFRITEEASAREIKDRLASLSSLSDEKGELLTQLDNAVRASLLCVDHLKLIETTVAIQASPAPSTVPEKTGKTMRDDPDFQKLLKKHDQDFPSLKKLE